MMNTIQQQLTSQAEGISCFAWNADRSMIAICPNNNEIHIYGIQQHTDSWQKKFTLCEVQNQIELSIVDEIIPGYLKASLSNHISMISSLAVSTGRLGQTRLCRVRTIGMHLYGFSMMNRKFGNLL